MCRMEYDLDQDLPRASLLDSRRPNMLDGYSAENSITTVRPSKSHFGQYYVFHVKSVSNTNRTVPIIQNSRFDYLVVAEVGTVRCIALELVFDE